MTQQIKREIERKLIENTENSTKLRYLRGKRFEREQYLIECESKKCKTVMKIRLNMVEAKANYKNKYNSDLTCRFCRIEEETTEHLFKCDKINRIIGSKLDTDQLESKIKSTKWLIEAASRVEEIEEMMKVLTI